jgi:hypothetical protein
MYEFNAVLRIPIRCHFDPWTRDGEKIRIRDEQPGSYFESLETIFWVKILKFFDADPESF